MVIELFAQSTLPSEKPLHESPLPGPSFENSPVAVAREKAAGSLLEKTALDIWEVGRLQTSGAGIERQISQENMHA